MSPSGGVAFGGVGGRIAEITMPTLAAQAAAFIAEAATVRRLSPHTVDSYRRDLRILTDAFANAQTTPADIRKLLAREGKRGASAASISRRLSAWRMFFDYLRLRGEIQSNPARGVRPPKKTARLPRAMTPDETAHFLETVPPADEWTAARDAAMFELLYSAGLRVGEMLALNTDDLDFAEGIARVRIGKGGRGRNAPFGGHAKTALQKWLALRRKNGGDMRALFINRRGGRLHSRTVQQRAAMRAALAGCAGRVSPHVLRHSCASHFLQSGGDLRATQDLLGHADISSTQIYTRLDFQNLARTYDRAHPRAAKTRKD